MHSHAQFLEDGAVKELKTWLKTKQQVGASQWETAPVKLLVRQRLCNWMTAPQNSLGGRTIDWHAKWCSHLEGMVRPSLHTFELPC